MSQCLVCRSADVTLSLELGPQPTATHFMIKPDAVTPQHHLALAICHHCGVAQLSKPFPAADLAPRFEWITYREPEGHLDNVVERILTLDGVSPNSVIAGLTFKEATTLERLRKRGFSNLWSVDPALDLGVTQSAAGAETLQAHLTVERAAGIVKRRGLADVLIARHVVEHSERPREFLQALGTMVAEGGYLIIEVPDCRKNFERQDYTMLWEEHSLYFTPETLPQVLAAAGCEPVHNEVHPCSFEDLIVLYARKSGAAVSRSPVEAATVARNVTLATAFGQSFLKWTDQYKKLLESWTADGSKVAAYGAGHLSAAFINFHQLTRYFAFVVDDTLQKQGLFMPKSGLEIVPRSRLNGANVMHCLFGVSPDVENKIMANNQDYIAAGGQFHSMFVDSPRSIRRVGTTPS